MEKLRVLAFLVILGICISHALVSQEADAAASEPVTLKQQKLGWTHTLLVPKGWKVEGGGWQPPPQAHSWIPSRNIVVMAPDGTTVHFK
ncbi:MAG: hypothetical protein AAF438_22325, partial [Pseudomonadota bacterium]